MMHKKDVERLIECDSLVSIRLKRGSGCKEDRIESRPDMRIVIEGLEDHGKTCIDIGRFGPIKFNRRADFEDKHRKLLVAVALETRLYHEKVDRARQANEKLAFVAAKTRSCCVFVPVSCRATQPTARETQRSIDTRNRSIGPGSWNARENLELGRKRKRQWQNKIIRGAVAALTELFRCSVLRSARPLLDNMPKKHDSSAQPCTATSVTPLQVDNSCLEQAMAAMSTLVQEDPIAQAMKANPLSASCVITALECLHELQNDSVTQGHVKQRQSILTVRALLV